MVYTSCLTSYRTTLENKNQRFSDIFRGYGNRTLGYNGLRVIIWMKFSFVFKETLELCFMNYLCVVIIPFNTDLYILHVYKQIIFTLTLSGPGSFDQPQPSGGGGVGSSPLSKIWSAWARVMKRGMHSLTNYKLNHILFGT